MNVNHEVIDTQGFNFLCLTLIIKMKFKKMSIII